LNLEVEFGGCRDNYDIDSSHVPFQKETALVEGEKWDPDLYDLACTCCGECRNADTRMKS